MKRHFLLLILAMTATTAWSQNRFDALRYTQQYPLLDPASMAMGGADAGLRAGAGSFLINPAAMALAKGNFYTIALGNREVSEDATFRGQTSGFNDNQTGISNIGFVFKAPTSVGSLVMGAGYAQTADFNRAWSVSAFNPNTSVTNFLLASPSDQYFGPGVDSYAIYDDETDGLFTVYDGAGGFRGAEQYAEYFERGQMGEYAIFLGTEFQKNLFVGFSVGLPAGQYAYRRDILEEDVENRYATSPYDIGSVTVSDRIHASIRGFNARIGLLYTPVPGLNLGLSYTTRTRFEVEEDYRTRVETEFDSFDENGDNQYWAQYDGEVSYRVLSPGRLNAGVSATFGALTVAASAERIHYGNIDMSGFGVAGDRDERRAIQREFTDATNLRVGAGYRVGQMTLKGGYGFNQSPSRVDALESQFLSGGLSVDLGNDMALEMGVQYLTRTDTQSLYRYGAVNETVRSDVGRLHTMIGLKVGF